MQNQFQSGCSFLSAVSAMRSIPAATENLQVRIRVAAEPLGRPRFLSPVTTMELLSAIAKKDWQKAIAKWEAKRLEVKMATISKNAAVITMAPQCLAVSAWAVSAVLHP